MRCLVWVVGMSVVVVAGCADKECPPTPGVSAATSAAAAATAATSATSSAAEAKLSFKVAGADKRALDLAALKAIPSETVRQFDPYYAREKTYRAWPLAAVIEKGFAGEQGLPTKEFVLKAKDGYTVPLRGAQVFEAGAYLAYEDVDAPGWEPIGQQRANPGPFYLVWANKNQTDLETHPRPYQLASIDIARFEDVFPFTVPTGSADDSPAMKGFAHFKAQCIHCHAINRQGGRVGPELNVPQSVVEYRSAEQIKAYIKNPLTFRYSTMPPHPSFSDEDLDALVAYFTAMKDRKHDDEKAPQPVSAPSTSAAPSVSAPASAPSSSPKPSKPRPPVDPIFGAPDGLDTRR